MVFTTVPGGNPFGPWTIPLSEGSNWVQYDYTFYDLLARAIPSKTERTGGTVSGVIHVLYRMPSVGLIASVGDSGIRIETTARNASERVPITGILSHIEVLRKDQPRDLAIWLRKMQTTAAAIEETDSGFTVTVPKRSLPAYLMALLNGNGAACKLAFSKTAKPEVVPFTITESSSDFRLMLSMDEDAKDAAWENLVSQTTSAKPALPKVVEDPAAILADVRRNTASSKRLESLRRLVFLFENSLAKASPADPSSRMAEMRLASVASRMTAILTDEAREEIDRLSARSTGSLGSRDRKELEKWEQVIASLGRQSVTNRKAFFEKSLSSGPGGLDRRNIDLLATARELDALAATPVPNPQAAGTTASAPEDGRSVRFFPQAIAICSKDRPDDDLLVVSIKQDEVR